MLSVIERAGDAVAHELPGREPRALKVGPGLAGDDGNALADLAGAANDAERRAVSRGRQRARVAVREYRALVRQQPGAVTAELTVGGDVFVVDRLRFVFEALTQAGHRLATMLAVHTAHAFDRPGEVHGRGAGVEQ